MAAINYGEVIKGIEKSYQKRESNFEIGNTVKVYLKIVEGKRERTQIFEGIVIAERGRGLGKAFKVRKMVGNIGVERTFPLDCPSIQKIEVIKVGKVRRAKLFFLRKRIGKATQLDTIKASN